MTAVNVDDIQRIYFSVAQAADGPTHQIPGSDLALHRLCVGGGLQFTVKKWP